MCSEVAWVLVSLGTQVQPHVQYSLQTTFQASFPFLMTMTKPVHTSAADLLHIRIRKLDWCKCTYSKNETREIDCLCCREVDAILIALAKIPERKGSTSPCSFYRQLLDY